MSINDLLGWPGPLTARQVAAWQQWHFNDLNEPGKVESYLMAIAADIRRVPSHVWGKRSDVQMDQCKITFVQKPPEPALTPDELTEKRKQAAEYSKAAWRSMWSAQRQQHLNKQNVKSQEELLQEEAMAAIARDKAKRAEEQGGN